MILTLLVFLFVIYTILETFKYSKPEFEEDKTRIRKKDKYKKIKVLNKKIVYLKAPIYFLFYVLLILNHFLDPLSNSAGWKGFILILVIAGIFLGVCIIDIVKIRKKEKKNE